MKSPTIKTDNYVIRAFKKEDATLWQEWDVDPETQAHMPEPVNEVKDIKEQYGYMKECEADENGYYWSVETKDGITIGTVSLFDIDSHHKSAKLGIVVGDKEYRSKGAATEIVDSVVAHAFNKLDISHIGAEVEPDNIPMRKVFHRTGFDQDGLFKKSRVKNEKRIDVIYFWANK